MKTPREIMEQKYGMEITKESHPCYYVAPIKFYELMEEYADQFRQPVVSGSRHCRWCGKQLPDGCEECRH
jgi:hypothetical protein